MTLAEYLNYTYNATINQNLDRLKTHVFICSSHFAHIIIRQIKQKIGKCSNELRSMIMTFIFLTIQARELEEIEVLFNHFGVICCSKYKSKKCLNSEKLFNNLVEVCIESNFDSNNIIEISNNNDFITNEIMLPSDDLNETPYYQKFFTIYNEISKEVEVSDESVVENNFYCAEFFKFLVIQYFKYLPLWTTFLLKKLGHEKNPNNVTIEGWFNSVKNRLILEKN